MNCSTLFNIPIAIINMPLALALLAFIIVTVKEGKCSVRLRFEEAENNVKHQSQKALSLVSSATVFFFHLTNKKIEVMYTIINIIQ